MLYVCHYATHSNTRYLLSNKHKSNMVPKQQHHKHWSVSVWKKCQSHFWNVTTAHSHTQLMKKTFTALLFVELPAWMKKEIKLNVFAVLKSYFISNNERQIVQKPISCDWTIDHVQTCILSIRSSILTTFPSVTLGLISMGWHYYLVDVTRGHWHLNTENGILVTGDCHRWIALLNKSI